MTKEHTQTTNLDSLMQVIEAEQQAIVDRNLNARHTLNDKTHNELLYRNNGFARLMVDVPVFEMVREWVDIIGDDENHCHNYLRRLRAKKIFSEALKWSKVYGGCLIVMIVDDGVIDLKEPVNENRIKGITKLKVFPRGLVEAQPSLGFTYNEPDYYSVTPINGGTPFVVHESRCLRFDGDQLPPSLSNDNQGWGDSIYESRQQHLDMLDMSLNNSSAIIADFVQTIFKMDGLGTILSQKDGDKKVRQRFRLINYMRQVLKMQVIDGKEDYHKVSSNVSGLGDLLTKFMMSLSATTRIPMAYLFGMSPAGMNSTGEHDMRNFYATIKAAQEEHILPPLERLLYLVTKSKDFRGKALEEYDITFKPLKQLSEKEQAEVQKIIADVDNININQNGVYDSHHAAKRYSKGRFNVNVSVDDEWIDQLEQDAQFEPLEVGDPQDGQ